MLAISLFTRFSSNSRTRAPRLSAMNYQNVRHRRMVDITWITCCNPFMGAAMVVNVCDEDEDEDERTSCRAYGMTSFDDIISAHVAKITWHERSFLCIRVSSAFSSDRHHDRKASLQKIFPTRRSLDSIKKWNEHICLPWSCRHISGGFRARWYSRWR